MTKKTKVNWSGDDKITIVLRRSEIALLLDTLGLAVEMYDGYKENNYYILDNNHHIDWPNRVMSIIKEIKQQGNTI